MTDNIETGGPAFPGLNGTMTGIDSDGIERWETEPSGGMSIRDYFAAKVMQGVVGATLSEINYSERAEFAYRQADAMLAARGVK